MKFLMEHEMAFDADELGFPSIQGCHAIVYQTKDGLFGYHNAGGSGDDRFKGRATKFAEFVRANGGDGSGTRLYGCSFIGNNQRGYSGKAKDKWKLELVTFATELGYTGKISGYDLHKTLKGGNDSAYVEYRKSGSKCDVHIRKWSQDEHPARSANPDQATHKQLQARGFNLSLINLATVVTGVDRNGVTKISKEKLR